MESATALAKLRPLIVTDTPLHSQIHVPAIIISALLGSSFPSLEASGASDGGSTNRALEAYTAGLYRMLFFSLVA